MKRPRLFLASTLLLLQSSVGFLSEFQKTTISSLSSSCYYYCCYSTTATFVTSQKKEEQEEQPQFEILPPEDVVSPSEVENNNDEQGSVDTPLTSAIVCISYDGARFTGWSAANEHKTGQTASSAQLTRPTRRQRRRGAIGELKPGHVRSVEGVLRDNLARIYGNVNPKRIVVEGCSRTDRGVHAKGMIAQIYCLKEGVLEQLEEDNNNNNNNTQQESTTRIYCSIKGKRKPHPISATDDSYFEPMPMDGNLSRLAFALNRMKPSDVQVTGIAPTPAISATRTTTNEESIFHPSLSTVEKTYEYRLSVGGCYDPTTKGTVWHVVRGASNTKKKKNNQNDDDDDDLLLDVDRMQQGCKILEGCHDFSAFQGAPRGADDKRKRIEQEQNNPNGSMRTLSSITMTEEASPMLDYFPGVEPPIRHFKITITGNRFLYKMVRFLVGSLVAVGTGKLEVEDLEHALEYGNWNVKKKAKSESGDGDNNYNNNNNNNNNNKAGNDQPRKQFECAPAHGLALRNADYGDIPFDWKPLTF